MNGQLFADKPRSSKDLIEYSGELGSACWSTRVTCIQACFTKSAFSFIVVYDLGNIFMLTVTS